jgi:hypothetical protein
MGFEDTFNKMQPVITGKNKAEKIENQEFLNHIL